MDIKETKNPFIELDDAIEVVVKLENVADFYDAIKKTGWGRTKKRIPMEFCDRRCGTVVVAELREFNKTNLGELVIELTQMGFTLNVLGVDRYQIN